ncbi:MAG: hypothetical protein ACPGVB_14590, partial [Chitinophagales bacterium]
MKQSNYKKSRIENFNILSKKLASSIVFNSSNTILAGGDAIDLLKKIPDNTISLILTDPPYHTTKKKNI